MNFNRTGVPYSNPNSKFSEQQNYPVVNGAIKARKKADFTDNTAGVILKGDIVVVTAEGNFQKITTSDIAATAVLGNTYVVYDGTLGKPSNFVKEDGQMSSKGVITGLVTGLASGFAFQYGYVGSGVIAGSRCVPVATTDDDGNQITNIEKVDDGDIAGATDLATLTTACTNHQKFANAPFYCREINDATGLAVFVCR